MNAAAKFYELKADGLGDDFLTEVKRALSSIQKHPNRWPVVEGNFRKHRVKKFPYSIAYISRDDIILIIAIAHQKRRPSYWKDRLSS